MNAFSEAQFRELETRLALREAQKAEAQHSFLSYYKLMTGHKPAPHHTAICKLVQAMEEDRIERAMVFTPPRMAKTTLCSMLAPSWILGRHPTAGLMGAVHTQKYAQKLGMKVRNYMRHPNYPFDTRLSDDSQAKDQFATVDGGEYNGFGLMGGSTHGNPAEWMFMDDLIKGRKMAMSEHMREEAWETYKFDLLSRLQGRQKQLYATTRWHEDDPNGRILPVDFDGKSGWYRDRETNEKWYVLCLPAKCEHENDPTGRTFGDWLWPDAGFIPLWEAMEKRGGYLWASLYQQRPRPVDGLMFKDEHINTYVPAHLDPRSLTIYLTSDYAVTAEAGSDDPDYTVHEVWGVDSDWNIYLLDIWRGRAEPDVWVKEFIRLVKRWKPMMAGEEGGQIIKSVGPFLKRQMREEGVYVPRKQLTSTTNKEARAQSLLGLAAMGKLWLPAGHPMTELFRAELLSFPGGKHDDMVDAATLFARMLAQIVSGTEPKKDSPHGESLMELFLRHEAEEGR